MRLLFVGDVMLGRLVNEVLKEKGPQYPWGDTLSVFKAADLRICNLECVISDRGQPWGAPPGASPWSQTEKVFHFRTDEKNIEVLKTANINLVSLANNHVLDFEYEAMYKMLRILDRHKITHAGCGKNLKEASSVGIVKIDRIKIGMIAFTDNEPDWEAKENKPGIFYVPADTKDRRGNFLLNKVKSAKEKVDILVISAHWGPNWGYHPPKEHLAFAHALVDAGADIIFGHSAHVLRGIEIYKDKVILYSTGDFVDDYAVDEIERNDESFIFMVETDDNAILGLTLYPTVISNFQAQLAKENLAEIRAKMQKLCSEFGTEAIWNSKEKSLKINIL